MKSERSSASGSTRSAGRRLSAITLDQAVAGGSNVIAAVLAARLLGVEAFGLFGIAFQVYVLAQGVSRGLVGEPLLVHPEESRERPGDAIGTALLVGLGVGVLVLASVPVASIWSGELARALAVLAVCMPLLVLQDVGRYLAFATHRPERALVMDSVWLALMVVGAFVLVAADAETLPWYIVAWAGSGALAGLLLLWYHRGTPSRPSSTWLRESWALSSRYLATYLTSQGAVLIASLALGAIAGARALGAVRGAQLLVRPYTTIETAAIAAATAEISHVTDDGALVNRHVRRTSTVTTLAALANAMVLILLPDALGRAVLGETWEAAEPLMLVAGLSIIFLALISGPRAGLLGSRRIGTVLAVDLTFLPIVLGASVVGAFAHGALGYYWAITLAQLAVVGPWWWVFRAKARTAESRPAER